MSTEKNTGRCLWVDIAKGIAIIAVVLLHIDHPWPDCELLPLDLLLGNGWHVNVFFILAGFFLSDAKLSAPKSFIFHKARTLYLPLLCFSIPAVLLHNAFIDIGWYDTSVNYGGKMVAEWGAGDMLRSLASVFLLAGREPILSALWFLCALFLALCGLSVVACVARRYARHHYIVVMLVVLFLLGVFSSVLDNVFGFYIPRFNNALTAMWLIYLGHLIRGVMACRFDNLWFASGAFLIFLSGILLLRQLPFRSFLLQSVIACVALYVVCFVSLKIESAAVGRLVGLCGRDSLYVMALQFVAFRVCTELLNAAGFALNPAALMPSTGGSILLLSAYLLSGLLLPIAFARLWRCLRDKIKVLI